MADPKYESIVTRFEHKPLGQEPNSEQGTCTQSEPFALQVRGDSMAPEFSDGCIVIVDPSAAIENGCFVVANLESEGMVLRKLIVQNQSWTFTTLNSAEPEIAIAPGPDAIAGVVVQRSGSSREQHKRYD